MSTPAYVGSTHAEGTFTTNTTVPYTATSGNSIVVVVTTINNVTPTVADGTNTYGSKVSPTNQGSEYLSVYEADGITGGALTLTIGNLGSSNFTIVTVVEVSGVSGFDIASAHAAGFGATFSVAAVTPSQSGDYALAVVHESSGNAVNSWSGGFSSKLAVTFEAAADQVIAGAGAVTASGTFSAGGTSWDAITILLAAAVAVPVTPKPIGGLPRVQWHFR